MKKLLSDYKDEKVDELIREALKKEVENIYVPNKMKEEIDAIIEKCIMRKNLNKKIGICILVGIILLV